MKALLFALGSHGDVHPFVGIGGRLRARGHEVTVAANEHFRSLIASAGLGFVPIGSAEQYRAMATDPRLWKSIRATKLVMESLAELNRPVYEAVRDFAARHGDDGVVVASSLALAARVARDKHGFPLASVHLSPSIFQSSHEMPDLPGMRLLPRWTPMVVKKSVWWVTNRVMDSLVGPSLNALRGELGLPAERNFIRDVWSSPDLTIGMFPQWYAAKQPDWPKHVVLTGFPLYDEADVTPLSAGLDEFLRAPGGAPIAFTPGSAMWNGRAFFEGAAAACVKLGRRGLLLTRHRDHLPATLPSGVIHVDYAPFGKLLPRCAAFVHHGGIGSTAQALAAGVPQLVTPFAHDQPDNAARVKRLGCGLSMSPSKMKSGKLAARLRELIESPTIGTACRETARKFEGVDAIGETCELIEGLRVRAASHAAA